MKKRPFTLTADLDFLYLSKAHTWVFNEVVTALNRRDGLICVTGEPGSGKTLLCLRLLEELGGGYNAVLVKTPPKTPEAMTETLDEAFGVVEDDSRIPVAIFDEAQHLDSSCLDHIKFLTNLEKDGEKLLQIILVGQPELAERLSSKRFIQLEQRIGAKLSLEPLRPNEVLPYLSHRLAVAGLAAEGMRFTRRSARYLYKKTSGNFCRLNRIANIAVERALRGAERTIGVKAVKRAEAAVTSSRGGWKLGGKPERRLARPLALSVAVLLAALSVGLLLYYRPHELVAFYRTRIAQSTPTPPLFALEAGVFLAKEQAEELSSRLAGENLSSTVVTKDLGEGGVIYQVRLPGPYSESDAEKVIGKLAVLGIVGVDKIAVDVNRGS